MIPDRGAPDRTCRRDTRGAVLVCRGANDQLKSLRRPARWGPRGCSAVGSAQPCQGWGREFESRHPLECSVLSRSNSGERAARGVKPHGGVAERLGTGLQSRLHGFESRRHLQALHSQLNPLVGAIGAAVARFPDTEEVTGSIPVSRTEKPPASRGFSVFSAAFSSFTLLAGPGEADQHGASGMTANPTMIGAPTRPRST